MNFRLPLFAAASLVLVAGCSGPDFGPEPDFASIEQRFAAPNGSLTEKNAASIFDRYASNRKSQDEMNINGATNAGGASAAPRSSSALGPRALQALDFGSSGASSTAGFRCDDIMSGEKTGSCDCPAGGTFDYDFEDLEDLTDSSGPVDIKLKTRFDACRIADASIDGRQFVRLQANRGLGGSGSFKLAMSIVADFRITQGGQTHSVDLVARLADGELEMALAVDDGWITVRASTSSGRSGTFVVRDRNGTWTCDVTDGKGTCKSDKGETRTF